MRRLALLTALALLVALPVAPAFAADTDRLAGDDRIGTAVAISQRAYPDGATAVYLARADVLSDALAAGSLTDGPVLLVPPCGKVPAGVSAEVRRLAPDEVVALGGEQAVCDELLATVGEGADTSRLAGASRFATAVAIAERAFPDGADTVYLADAVDSPDAVAGGSLTDGPTLLVPSAGAPDAAVVDAVATLDPGEVVALGGTAAVADETLGVAAAGRRVGRLAGDSRFTTAAAIAGRSYPGTSDVVYLGRADVFADAVAAGTLTDGPVLLVPSCGDVPPAVTDALTRLAPDTVIALGGTAAVCDELLAAAAGQQPPPEPPPAGPQENCFEDPVGDAGDPRSDIVRVCISFSDILTFTVEPVQPTDPTADPNWTQSGSGMSADLDTDGDGEAEFLIGYYVAGDFLLQVVDAETGAIVCEALPAYDGTRFVAGDIPDFCFGSPAGLRMRVLLEYDDAGTRYLDEAPEFPGLVDVPRQGGPPQVPTTSDFVLAPDGLGPVTSGQPDTQVVPTLAERLGAPTDDYVNACPEGPSRVVGWGGLAVVFDPNSALVAWAYGSELTEDSGPAVPGLDEPPRTPQGVTIGSTVADLRTAFGAALVIPTEDTDLFGFTWFVEGGAYSGALTGTGDSDTVTFITNNAYCSS